jgi:hypothetical protein
MADGIIDNLVISSKFTSEVYPTSPISIFKGHFDDLAWAVECFKKSPVRRSVNQSFSGAKTARDIGVLFWLSGNKSSYEDIVSKVATAQVQTGNMICLVDNKKASFLYESRQFLLNKYPDCEVQYFYPSNGSNLNPVTRRTAGPILPVEFINSPVLAYRIADKLGHTRLSLCISDEFDFAGLKRLMGLGQELSRNFASNTLILFPNYQELFHRNAVREAKTILTDRAYTETVQVGSYRSDFREFQNA